MVTVTVIKMNFTHKSAETELLINPTINRTILAALCFVFMSLVIEQANADEVKVISGEQSSIVQENINQTYLNEATLVGQGVLKIYWAKVYILSYYTKDENGDGAADVKALHYEYLRHVPKDATLNASREEFQRYPDITDAKLDQWMAYLDQALSDMNEGDQAIIMRQGDGTITFHVSNRPEVVINDAEFSQVFMNIWLGADTNYPGLRKQLLALM